METYTGDHITMNLPRPVQVGFRNSQTMDKLAGQTSIRTAKAATLAMVIAIAGANLSIQGWALYTVGMATEDLRGWVAVAFVVAVLGTRRTLADCYFLAVSILSAEPVGEVGR